jgi:hypothetical protein
LVENGLYGKYLKHYLSLFSRDQIHIIFFQDIKNKPKDVVQSLYHFLGVEKDFIPDIINQKYNSSEVRSSYLFKTTNQIYFFLKDSKIGKIFLDMLRAIGINSKTVQKLSYTFSKKEKTPYGIDKKSIYRNFFKDDIQKLEKLLNKDLSHWKY